MDSSPSPLNRALGGALSLAVLVTLTASRIALAVTRSTRRIVVTGFGVTLAGHAISLLGVAMDVK
jgi:hypothetical protein